MRICNVMTVVIFLVVFPICLGNSSIAEELVVEWKKKANELDLVVFARALDKHIEDAYMDEVMALTPWEIYKVRPELVKHKPMSKADIIQLIEDVSRAEYINPIIIKAIVQAESSFRVSVTSPKGAFGLMQLMPKTAKELGIDRYNPVENLIGGIRYFKQMRDQFMGYTTLALAAYNAGPKRIIGLKIPKIRETQRYVKLVYKLYYQYRREALI